MARRCPLVIASLLIFCVMPVFAGDLKREIALIRQLGKDEIIRRTRAAEPPTAAEVKVAAKTIDEYITSLHRENNVRPNRSVDDDVFVRRIYLDIAGRIPTYQETMAFIGDKSRDKRAALIDKLLESEAYIQNDFNFWADLLRVQTNSQGYYGGQAFGNWIKNALRTNMPYDRMVYELVTSEGYPWQNGAAGFYLRDDGMPLDHMATSVQVFLGTSLQCAQCHDHPFDKWSQYEFYEMAAYTFGVQTRTQADNLREAYKLAGDDQAVRIALNRIARPLTFGVRQTERRVKLPHDYKYDDAKPNQAIEPYTIFGGTAEPSADQSLRDAYAKWIIDRQNPRFTTVIANRMWKKVFGMGMIEPVDQMTDDSMPVHPELMAFLTYKMESLGYDLRAFQRMLYNTQLYQRQVADEDPAEGKPYYFPGPMLHRMTAEQFWDSLVTLVIPEPDYRRGPMSDGSYYQNLVRLQEASPDELISMSRERVVYETRRRELNDKIREARAGGNEKQIAMLMNQMRSLRSPGMMMDGMAMYGSGAMNETIRSTYGYDMPTKPAATWKGYPAQFVRAAEVGSPAPTGHFLSQFGQSDREVINNANDEPNLIQVLAMFNGPVFEQVIRPDSQLMQNVQSAGSPEDIVNGIFLSVLNREPTASEKRAIQQGVLDPARRYNRGPDYGKVVWALLNTREFSFVQ